MDSDKLTDYIRNYPVDKRRGFVNKHPHLLSKIKEMTNFLPDDSPWNQRLFHIEHPTDYPVVCPACGNPVKWKTDARKYMTFCSKKCSANTPSTITTRKETNKNKYGVEHYAQSDDYCSKSKQTNLKKYGVEFASQAQDFRMKVETTNMNRYGVKSSIHIGMDNRFSKEKIVDHHTFKNIPHDVVEKLFDKSWLYDSHIVQKKSLATISKELNGYDISSLSKRLKSFDIPIINHYQSEGEREIANFLTKLDINIITRDRKLIHPMELDIVIPDYKIAIEFNGLFWHGENCVADDYHYRKYNACKNKGYRLITIFEDEWVNKSDIIKRKLAVILNKSTERRVFARKTTIVEISNDFKKRFFNTNHIQGNGPSSLNYGLQYEGEVVAVIGFIASGSTLTLNRYATSCNVIGGFSKLLNYVDNTISYTNMVTFADLRWSIGSLYYNMGFSMDKEIPHDYEYIVGKKRVHKFNYRHGTGLNKLPNYNPLWSEHRNMLNHELYRIWDCGKLRFVKTKE